MAAKTLIIIDPRDFNCSNISIEHPIGNHTYACNTRLHEDSMYRRKICKSAGYRFGFVVHPKVTVYKSIHGRKYGTHFGAMFNGRKMVEISLDLKYALFKNNWCKIRTEAGVKHIKYNGCCFSIFINKVYN